MNWNGQRPYVDHFIAVRSDPSRAKAQQDDLNARRRKRLIDANLTRPVYLPLVFEMAAAGQVSPYRDTTKSLGYDVLVIGAIGNTAGRSITITESAGERNPLRHGNQDSLHLLASEFAGQVAGGGGETGIHYFATPTLVRAGETVTVEMFKEDTTADIETKRIVLVGIQVFNRAYAEQSLRNEAPFINRFIVRENPVRTFLKVKFDFNSAVANGEAADIYTPKVEEPLLIRGMRTTLLHSLIEMGLIGEALWTTRPTPCWAIAASGDIEHDGWLWFPKPVYLRRNQQVDIRRVVNAGDNGDLDPETDNTITFYCETV